MKDIMLLIDDLRRVQASALNLGARSTERAVQNFGFEIEAAISQMIEMTTLYMRNSDSQREQLTVARTPITTPAPTPAVIKDEKTPVLGTSRAEFYEEFKSGPVDIDSELVSFLMHD